MLRLNGRTIYAIIRDARKRQIVLWGGLPEDAAFVQGRLALVGVDAALVDDDSLCDGSLAGCTMIVTLHDDYLAAADKLDAWGYAAGSDYRWIKRYGNENLRAVYAYDPMLGFNSLGDAATPGFFRYGSASPGAKRIVVLGGSTADQDTFLGTSWPEMLAQVISESGVDACVYNGAVTGFTSAQELMKLLRDVPALRPHAVIFYSGINNIHLVSGQPFMTDYQIKLANTLDAAALPTVNLGHLEPYRGLIHDAKGFDKAAWWMNHMELALTYCELIGAVPHVFLQPNLMTKPKECLLPEEREYLINRSFMGRMGLTPEGYGAIAQQLCSAVESRLPSSWLHDLTHVLDHAGEALYYDGIHVSDAGNAIIAQGVWAAIRDSLR